MTGSSPCTSIATSTTSPRPSSGSPSPTCSAPRSSSPPSARLATQGSLKVADAIILVKDTDGRHDVCRRRSIRSRRSRRSPARCGPGSLGLILAGPIGLIAGGAIGAGTGAVAAKVIDIGIPDEWVDWFKEAVPAGHRHRRPAGHRSAGGRAGAGGDALHRPAGLRQPVRDHAGSACAPRSVTPRHDGGIAGDQPTTRSSEPELADHRGRRHVERARWRRRRGAAGGPQYADAVMRNRPPSTGPTADPQRGLLDAAAEGDGVALAELVRQTQPIVWSVCRALGTPGEEADLVQETYLRAIALARLVPRRGAGTRLVAVDRPSRVRRPRPPPPAPAPADRQARAPRRPRPTSPPTDSVDDLLEALHPDRREAFVLTQYAGLGYEEAAAVIGCPVGTIRSRVSRARADLLAAMRADEAR